MVAMAARRQDRMDEIKDMIEKEGGVAICVKTDVTDRKQVSSESVVGEIAMTSIARLV